MESWSPNSWQTKPVEQQPDYPDAVEVDRAVDAIAKLPPLVTSWEVESLKNQLGKAGPRRNVSASGRRLR